MCADERRRSLAVCVEIDLAAEAAEKAAKAEASGGDASSGASVVSNSSSTAAGRGGGSTPYPVSPYQVSMVATSPAATALPRGRLRTCPSHAATGRTAR
jgi:hypothetical protein